jgi:hypothetical protein
MKGPSKATNNLSHDVWIGLGFKSMNFRTDAEVLTTTSLFVSRKSGWEMLLVLLQEKQEYRARHMYVALVHSDTAFKVFVHLCCVRCNKMMGLPCITWWVMCNVVNTR